MLDEVLTIAVVGGRLYEVVSVVEPVVVLCIVHDVVAKVEDDWLCAIYRSRCSVGRVTSVAG